MIRILVAKIQLFPFSPLPALPWFVFRKFKTVLYSLSNDGGIGKVPPLFC